jgi:CBS-domain-containing membrane protein
VTLDTACTPDLVTVPALASTEEAETLMRTHALRRLPVVSDDRHLQGVVTIGDLAKQTDRKSALADISKAPANN